jgi:hypothetical protein
MRFYWKDWFDVDSEVQLRRYPYGSMSDYQVLATLESSGTSKVHAESITESDPINVTIDNTANVYIVWVDLHYNEDDLTICSILIGYKEPIIFGAALPLVQNDQGM